MTELSTHLFRDKKADDSLEALLEEWGAYIRWGVHGLSFKRKSPTTGLNKLCRDLTDEFDRAKRKSIRVRLEKDFSGDELTAKVQREFKEWRERINALPMPTETQNFKPVIPNYGGHKKLSRVDRLLSEINQEYYKILIYRYANEWELGHFVTGWGKDLNYVSKNMERARKSARKILKKNGFKV